MTPETLPARTPAALLTMVAAARASGRTQVEVARELGITDRLVRHYDRIARDPERAAELAAGIPLRAVLRRMQAPGAELDARARSWAASLVEAWPDLSDDARRAIRRRLLRTLAGLEDR